MHREKNSDGTNLFVANTTDGILYRVPLTATGAAQVITILDKVGQISSYATTTTRVFMVVPVNTTDTKIISVPKSGGAVREDVPAAAGSILSRAAGNRFYYTRSVLSTTVPPTVVSSTTVALKEDGTPLSSFANAGLTGIRLSEPFNVRGPIGVVTEVLVSTYVGGVLSGGTMAAVATATAVATTIVGTIPSTVPSLVQLFFSWSSVDHAALSLGLLSESINRGVFFMDSATPNSLYRFPWPWVLGRWFRRWDLNKREDRVKSGPSGWIQNGGWAMRKSLVVTIAMAGLLAGCSSEPSEADIRKAYAKKLDD